MQFEIPETEIRVLVPRQLENLFLPLTAEEKRVLDEGITAALPRCEKCFSVTPYKGYRRDGEVLFNPYHSGQYSIFLYFLSNTLAKQSPECRSLAARIYYLNKALNSVELYFEVELPDIFFVDHPLGSVIGRAVFKDHFAFHQNCTVGNNRGLYPRIGKHVTMLANSQIIGDCDIGDHVMLAANTCVIDEDVPECSLVFGRSPNLIFKPRPKEFFLRPLV